MRMRVREKLAGTLYIVHQHWARGLALPTVLREGGFLRAVLLLRAEKNWEIGNQRSGANFLLLVHV
jgi:hypothetical protein